VLATTKAYNVCRPATEALIQLLGKFPDERVVGGAKGKGRAIEPERTDGSLGLRPIYPAVQAQPLFVPSVVKRIESSDVSMAARRFDPGLPDFHEYECELIDPLSQSSV